MKGWFGESGRHSLAAKGIKTVQRPLHKTIRGRGVYYDEMGVRAKEVALPHGIVGIDAGIADIVKVINDSGYESVQSMSGLKTDYVRAPDRYSPNGYLGFWKSDLKPGQEEEIHNAAKRAGLYALDSEIFFFPAISVRTGLMKDGSTSEELTKEANRIAGVEEAKGKDIEIFLDAIHRRDKIRKRLVREAGGPISEREIAKRWERFAKELTGKRVSVLL